MPNNVPEWSEFSKILSFRKDGQIKIPKSIREKSFSIAIDIEIVAVLRELYADYTSYPANGYYGKVVLVQRDYSEIHIELTQPRQRLHYFYSDSSVVGWYNFIQTDFMLRGLKTTQELICALYPLISAACVPIPCPDVLRPPWIEDELREIYIECEYGTSFRVEITNRVFAPYSNVCGDIVSPISGQEDNSKDNGLPASGSQPQKTNNTTDPYGGFLLPSSEADKGEFALTKGGLDNPNTANNIQAQGQRLSFGNTWIDSYNGSTPVLGSEVGKPAPFAPFGCQSGQISSIFIDSVSTNRGTANTISFRLNGVEFNRSQFLGTSSDFSIEQCLR